MPLFVYLVYGFLFATIYLANDFLNNSLFDSRNIADVLDKYTVLFWIVIEIITIYGMKYYYDTRIPRISVPREGQAEFFLMRDMARSYLSFGVVLFTVTLLNFVFSLFQVFS
jgi:hypothetical protein